jgi:hypothetical protein
MTWVKTLYAGERRSAARSDETSTFLNRKYGMWEGEKLTLVLWRTGDVVCLVQSL